VLYKEIPFLRIGLPLCAGIISGLYIKPGLIFLVLVAVIIISGFSISLLFNKYRLNLLFGYTLTISLFMCGLLLYTNEKNSISTLKNEQSIYSCTLTDFPEEKENSYQLIVKLNGKITHDGIEKVKGSIILYNKKDSLDNKLLPGDLLVIKCTPLAIVSRGNPYEFDYRFYMENHGIRYYSFTNSHDIISHDSPAHTRLVYRALIIRNKIIEMYRARGITGENLAVVAAITLGQKNMLDPEQKQNFIKAGVIHIMAVSGLHAVILSLFIFNLLFFLKRRFNLLRILIAILILWAFAFVTGLTPSVLRATLMFSFLQAGKLMNRRVNGINSVLASAFILILIKPSAIFNAGFLLSYSAVIYIISFYQDLYHKLHFKNRFTDKIWQSAVITIVAQAGTLPLTIMLFNRFPTYFIFTNIIIIPFSSLLIVTGCLVVMTFPVHFLSQILATILNYLTGTTELLTKEVSSLPYSTIENIGMTPVECLLLTLTIFIFSYFILKKKSFSIIYPLLFMFLFVIAGTISEISTRTTNELIVFNTPGSSTIGIRTGKILNLYSETTSEGLEVKKVCATLRLKLKTNTIKNKFCFIRAGEKNILISKSLDETTLRLLRPDIIVIIGLWPEIEKNISPEQSPSALIVASGVSSGFQFLRQSIFINADTVHIVRKSGAFIKRI